MAKHRPHAAKKPASHYSNQASRRSFPADNTAYSASKEPDRKTTALFLAPFMWWPSYLFEKMLNPWRNATSVISWMDSWQVGRRLTVPKSQSSETAAAYHYMIELPGITREKIALRFQNGIITLDAEGTNRRSGKHHHRNWRVIRRSFTLPAYTDSAAIMADLKEDVLTITVPKTDTPSSPKPRTIPIE